MNNVALASNQQATSPQTGVDPVVLCASDDRYAMPLAVTLVSAVQNLKAGHELHVYVVDGGIREENKERLLSTLSQHPISLNWIDPSSIDLSDLKISHHISHTAYLRLLADRWLPKEIDKVIYLDSDLLVLNSLTELWEQPLGDAYCMAVPDIACPFLDAARNRSSAARSLPYLASWNPVPNYLALGLKGSDHYFNSGVMILNLAQWRKQNLGERLLQVLRENEKHVWCWDQYALNAVCAGHWIPLPMRWNVGGHVYEYPSSDRAPVSPADFLEMQENPAIIHFTTEFKPWDSFCTHPLKARFFDWLDRTEWSGWRPEPRTFRLGTAWEQFAVWICRKSTVSYRKLVLLKE